jgi:hypothetical protein
VYITRPAHPDRLAAVLHGVLRRPAAANAQEDFEVKNLKKAAALTMVAGSLVAAGAGVASATDGGAWAEGGAVQSPGVVSGNLVQAPGHVPANVVGNTVNVFGALNPAFGNAGVNG